MSVSNSMRSDAPPRGETDALGKRRAFRLARHFDRDSRWAVLDDLEARRRGERLRAAAGDPPNPGSRPAIASDSRSAVRRAAARRAARAWPLVGDRSDVAVVVELDEIGIVLELALGDAQR
jgi:hypothetical protein